MSEITKTKKQRPKTSLIWWIFAFVIIAVYFFGLGSLPLVGPDEARYAQIAREMSERGGWITPTLGNFNWFEKPALLYWLQIVSYKLFGVSEFAARFGSAVFGLLTIFSLWILGRQWSVVGGQLSVEESNSQLITHNSQFSNWLALISASSIGLITFSRGASFDIILTFPITVSLVSFFIFEKSNKKLFTTYHLPLIVFYFFIGVELLAKGLVGIILPLAIVAFYYLLSWKLPDKAFVFSLFWGTILSLLVASIWYAPMYLRHGWTFIDEFFIQHHFARYVSNKYQHPQPFYFFFWVLPLMTLPWLPFFLASLVKIVGGQWSAISKSNPKLTTHHSPLTTFAFAWLLVPLVFFSFSGSKLPGYILPALPAALILTAEYVCRFAEKSRKRKIFVQIVALATFAFVAVALQFFAAGFARHETVKNLIETADAQGYTNEKVLNLHTISHNAEFYAAGRLIRDADGKLKKFLGVSEVAEEIRREGAADVLVLVPLEYLQQLTDSDLVEAKVLDENGELAIVLVKNK
jgi:4-amino-4-deoxy-L-arabinose transferase-like glycosyltransferase